MGKWSAADVTNAIGIGLTLVTALRTASIAKRTRQAAERTESRVAINQVLILIPELKHLERHLQVACNQNGRITARGVLNDWRLSASELSGFLDSLDPPLPGDLPAQLSVDLQESLGLAHEARELLLAGGMSVVDATSKLREVVAKVCVGSATLGAQLKSSGTLPQKPSRTWIRHRRPKTEQGSPAKKGKD